MLLKRYGKLKRQLQGAMGRQALTVRMTKGSSNTGTGPKKDANNMDMIQVGIMIYDQKINQLIRSTNFDVVGNWGKSDFKNYKPAQETNSS